MNRIRDWTLLAFAVGAACGPPEVAAQEAKATPTVLTIRPAGAPSPALKYRLTPERRSLAPGNAAIFYHRACLMAATASRDSKTEEKAQGWLSGAPGDIPREEAGRYLERYRNIVHEAELGAIQQDCDWGFDRREEGYDLLLPEIQEIRQAGRAIALKARLAVLEGKPDEAVHWIQVGLTMSRHLGETPFLIPSLVGMAISGQIKQPIEDLIQSPGGPNLYWAFANRPRPLIDLDRPIEGERYLLERELPGLREVDGPSWSNEKARSFGDELFSKMRLYTGEPMLMALSTSRSAAGAPRLEDIPSRLTLAAMVARIYPEAKRTLIAAGRSAAEVEAMPTLQVVMIHTLRAYHAFRDDVFKWCSLPYWQSHDRIGRAWKSHRDISNKLANPILAMFTSLMPAIESGIQANARAERQLDAFQCVEAIRMYAAEHGGALPESLDAMTETPVPIDPVIGRPFEYKKVDDTTATLSASYPPGGPRAPQYTIHYELKLAK